MIKCNMGKLEIRGIRAVLMADLHTMLRGLMESEILPYGVIKSILEVAKCETEGTDPEEGNKHLPSGAKNLMCHMQE